MRSKTLVILGSFVVGAVLLINACEGGDDKSPLQMRAPDVTVEVQRIPADGISNVDVTVTVLSTDGKKVENVAVDFRSLDVADTTRSLGTLSQTTAITDADGQATVTLTSVESTQDTSAVVRASVSDTTGYILNPKTSANVQVAMAPPGAVVIVSSGRLDDEELEARLHAILLQRAQENAAERRKGLSAILGDPQGGEGTGTLGFDAVEQVVIFEGIVITLTSNKTQLPADGVSTATIEARVRTTRGINVQSMPLIFSAREGKITPTGTTDQFGSATATLTAAITDSTQDIVIVRMGYTIVDTLLQTYVQPVLTISADDASIAADGSSTTTARARLLTPAGNPVAGASVAFTLSGPNDASITVQGTTSSAGEATAILKAGGTAGTSTITASFSSLTAATAVQLLGLNVSLTPAKTTILANGTATTTITLVAKTQTTNVAVVGKEVTFATNLGTMPATSSTDASGIATVNLKSATTAGTATVTAVIGTVTVTTTVDFTATANISVELSSSATRLLRDGQDETAITASVVDGEGNALQGRVVTFALTGQGTLSTTQPQQTGQGGTVSVGLLSDAAVADGNAQIIASSEGQSDTLDMPLRGLTLVLTSNPSAIVANGTNKSAMTLLVKETTTNAGVTGRSVQFATTLGTIIATKSTDLSGVASVDLTSGTTAGTATVTATLGTLSTTADVDFLVDTLTLNISAAAGSILRDGIATVDITITAQDPNGNLLNSRSVGWTVTGGSSATVFPDVGLTGQGALASGTHVTTLTADANSADAIATVTATVGGLTADVDIDLTGVSLTSFVQPDTILANGSETAVFTWQATRTTSGAVIPNHEIVIRKVSGPNVLLSDVSATTNSSGIATVTVKSTTNAGDLIMEAELGGVAKPDTLNLLQDQFSLTLASEESTLLRDGAESTDLTALVLDKFGDPVTDQRVDFA
ncbi:Ig-like domain-containing protein, partial [Gemmatimonadota bacterium]